MNDARRIQSHRPLLGVVVAFGVGVVLSRYMFAPFKFLFFGGVVFLLSAGIFSRHTRFSMANLLLALVVSGMLYAQGWARTPAEHINSIARYYSGTPVELEGKIISDVEHRKFFRSPKLTFTLKITRFKTKWGWKKKRGLILVNIFRDMDIVYGDTLRLEGRLHRPFNFSGDANFSYPGYLENKGIRWLMSVGKGRRVEHLASGGGQMLKSAALRCKHRFSEAFRQYLTPNEAGIMQAMILGDRYNVPGHIRQLFVETGTAHILAISGLHVGLVAFLFFVMVKLLPIGRKGHYILTIVLLIFYALLTGGRPSVVRATIMAVVFILSFLFERQPDSLNTLSLAAVLILLLNPMNLFDVGFQLSFISVLSIILGAPVILARIPDRWARTQSKWQRFLIQSLVVSLAAGLGVSGLIAYYFGIVTPVTILANLWVIPFLSVVVALGVGLWASACILPLGAVAFAACLKLALNLMVAGTYCFSCLPGAYFYLEKVHPAQVLIYYLFLAGLFFFCRGRRIDKDNQLCYSERHD